MKSLKESLFDKDLTEKDLTIRQTYELSTSRRGVAVTGVPVGYFFNVKKLLEYPNPYNWEKIAQNNSLNYLIGIIADQPIPSKSTIKTSDHKWCENLKKVLTKYIMRPWKSEWDKKVDIYLIEYPNDSFGVSIDYNCGDGSYEFIFNPKQ